MEAEWRIYASVNSTIIGSDNGLSPGRRQAIIWTNTGLLSIGTLWNKLYWNLNQDTKVFIHENEFQCVVCEMAAILSWPQCVKQSSVTDNDICSSSFCMWAAWWASFHKPPTRGTFLTADGLSHSTYINITENRDQILANIRENRYQILILWHGDHSWT